MDEKIQIKKLLDLNFELENYFRNTIIPQLFVDANLILRKFTPPAMKHFKLSATDIGRSMEDIKDNFRFSTMIDHIEEVIKNQEILEKEIQTTDLRWYQMNIIPYITIQDKKTNGVIITFVEITMRIKDLKEQERLISDHETLLDTLSHDIKTPLTSLVLAIDLFKNVKPYEIQQSHDLFKLVENSIKKMKDIIHELTYTRQQEYKYKTEEELLNFENILEDIRLILNDDIVKTQAIITTKIDVSEMTFSRRKLRSIVYNLVGNAIKFKLPDGVPKILITTTQEANFIIISVKDNGIGIDGTKHESVFTKYFRVENEIEGSGIGLYLVKEIVTNAGGKIVLNSKVGEGAEFKVYLKY